MTRRHDDRPMLPRFAAASDATPAAGGGLLTRRALLRGAVALGAGGAFSARAGDAHLPAARPSQQTPGRGPTRRGEPSRHETAVERTPYVRYGSLAPGNGGSFTPLQRLQGIITPSALHFERHHHGVPDIDPASHRLVLHGMVGQPLAFDVERLLRYPMTSRILFLECSGNSFPDTQDAPPQVTCGQIHGLVSCSEWTGVPLALLLEEAGVDPEARWIVAEGADAVTMHRSIPLEKALDDCLVALFQNGERLRPEQGYPLRLIVPGWEGNVSVKWLHRVKVVDAPVQARDETSHYTDPLPDGRALQFTFEMGVKSVITHPSPGWVLQGPGYYDISGLAWSGAGRIERVELSADGGQSWADAELQGTALPLAFQRFRLAWEWDGAPVSLMSRATDERGRVQPARDAWLAAYGAKQRYHYHAIQVWRIDDLGEVTNAYA